MADTPADPRDPDEAAPLASGRGPASGSGSGERPGSVAGSALGSSPEPPPRAGAGDVAGGGGAPPAGPMDSLLTPAPGSGLEGLETDRALAEREMSRNRFLMGATIGVGGVMSAAIAVPALGFVLAPVFQAHTYYDVDIGPVENFPQSREAPWHVVIFESRPNDESGLSRRVAFVRNDGNDRFTAISNTCMHLGCPVRAFGDAFGCPCHGGQYDSEGRRTAGPPVRPLNRYETRVKNGRVYLGQLYAVDNELQRKQIKGPGQPVEGILSFLYPPAPQA